LILMWK